MFSLILLLVVALGFGYFATQNTQSITLTLINTPITGIPLYVVIGITLLIGFAVCWLISLSDTFSSFLTIRGKNSKINNSNKALDAQSKQIRQLELENAKLQGELKSKSSQ